MTCDMQSPKKHVMRSRRLLLCQVVEAETGVHVLVCLGEIYCSEILPPVKVQYYSITKLIFVELGWLSVL